ncbi:MAG: hypothetical protein AVDCRST_MAG32-944, partial [uncultured Nocardioides sp.]
SRPRTLRRATSSSRRGCSPGSPSFPGSSCRA